MGPGFYTVTITDANGCIKSEDFEITEPPVLELTLLPSDETGYGITCFEANDGVINTLVEGGNGGYTYAWVITGTDDVISTDESLSALEPGDYTLTVTDLNGCTAEDNFEITEPDPIVITEIISDNSGYGVTCNGYSDASILTDNGNDANVVGGTGVYTYAWTVTGTTDVISTDQNLTAMGPGFYTVHVSTTEAATD